MSEVPRRCMGWGLAPRRFLPVGDHVCRPVVKARQELEGLQWQLLRLDPKLVLRGQKSVNKLRISKKPSCHARVMEWVNRFKTVFKHGLHF